MMTADKNMQTALWILRVAANMTISLGLAMVRVIAVLTPRHSKEIGSYSSGAIAGERREDTGEGMASPSLRGTPSRIYFPVVSTDNMVRALRISVLLSLCAAAVTYPSAAETEQPTSLSILKGKQEPVCRAYMELVKSATKDMSLYCDRTLRESRFGFDALQVVPLTDEQIKTLYPAAEGLLEFASATFFYSGRPGHGKDLSKDAAALSKAITTPLSMQHSHIEHGELPLYYRLSLDIDSDGRRDDVLVWTAHGMLCGAIYGNVTGGAKNGLSFLDSNGMIDEKRTRRLFWDHGAPRARQISSSLNVLSFHSRIYVDSLKPALDLSYFGIAEDDYVEYFSLYRLKAQSLQQVCDIEWRHTAR
jgi:hypothetical protein